jgi:hypothetical protein
LHIYAVVEKRAHFMTPALQDAATTIAQIGLIAVRKPVRLFVVRRRFLD